MGLRDDQPLFCTISSGERLSAGGVLSQPYVRALLKRLAMKAGISKRVHPHAFRHFFAHTLHDQRLSVREIQDCLGHSRLDTTATYLRSIAPPDLSRISLEL